MNVVVYTKDGCPFCSLLKNQLNRKDIPFTSFDLSDDALRAEFYANTGTSTVPQLFLTDDACSLTVPSGHRVGGWREVSANWSLLSVNNA